MVGFKSLREHWEALELDFGLPTRLLTSRLLLVSLSGTKKAQERKRRGNISGRLIVGRSAVLWPGACGRYWPGGGRGGSPLEGNRIAWAEVTD